MPLKDATALLPVSDVDDAVAFFRDTLGFTTGPRFPGYAYMCNGGATLRLIAAPEGTDMHDPARQQGIYIDTDDIDAVYASLRPALDELPNGHVRPPFDQPYGQREFHIYYEALQIVFGAAIADGTKP